jgi:3-methyladenine DNA glycosylase AlkC
MKIPKGVLAELNEGTREASNLVEALAVDFAALMAHALPEIPPAVIATLKVGQPTITQRMQLAGAICFEHLGLAHLPMLTQHTSDTVRGWAAYMIGLAPGLSLAERLQLIRPLADDPHFGVREWAWMPLRTHISADIARAITLLEPWIGEESPFLRRFAIEATRPRGVWTAHIGELKDNPRLGLPLLKPLRADPEKYVQDSVANWLNDAAKSQPDWVRSLVESWADGCDDKNTLRICRRAVRSIPHDA